jgi:SCY1-like protein 1
LGYSLGAALSNSEKTPIWKIYESKNKETKEAALVFVYETRKEDANKSLRNVARNGLQKLKTLRHPNILKFYNAVESESSISFATEEALPLYEYVQRYGPLTKDSIYWGLHCLAKALEFIHNDCKLSHGTISPASVFITPGGDW